MFYLNVPAQKASIWERKGVLIGIAQVNPLNDLNVPAPEGSIWEKEREFSFGTAQVNPF